MTISVTFQIVIQISRKKDLLLLSIGSTIINTVQSLAVIMSGSIVVKCTVW